MNGKSERQIEKCSSPTGDGNHRYDIIEAEIKIEKCSSPTGDGNSVAALSTNFLLSLRNVVPRQGTEIFYERGKEIHLIRIEKCSSPTGDGNHLRI